MGTTWNNSRFGPGSYEHASQEDRSSPRLRVHIAASLRAAGSRGFATIVRDIGLGGVTASAPNRIEPHTFCWLTLPGFEPIRGEAVWWEAGLVGLAFATLLSDDQFAALVDQHSSGTTNA